MTVRIAGSVNLSLVLAELSKRRPVFHSEADFQQAFAWQVHTHDAAIQVRLETRPAPGLHLELAFTRPDLERHTAIELKYLSRAWVGEVDGEQFSLKNHAAQDIWAYDVVKDIVRVERFVAGRAGTDAP